LYFAFSGEIQDVPFERDSATTIKIESEKSQTISRSLSASAAYWRADSFYTLGNYAQAARTYLEVIDGAKSDLARKSTKVNLLNAVDAYNKGQYKLAADLRRNILLPLAEQGKFGPPPLK
jgi:hypothetical protein